MTAKAAAVDTPSSFVDAPSNVEGRRVVIVGGGWAGERPRTDTHVDTHAGSGAARVDTEAS